MFLLKGFGLYFGDNAEKIVNDDNHLMMAGIEEIKNFVNNPIYDFIYIEDILQKLNSIEEVLELSYSGVKENGFVLVKVPDFNLYEKYLWPSIYMLDHKLSFSNEIKRNDQNRNTHYHLDDIKSISEKIGYRHFESSLDDTNFDYERPLLENQTKNGASCHIYYKFTK